MNIRIGSMHGKTYEFEKVKKIIIDQTKIDCHFNITFENGGEMRVGTRNDHVVLRIDGKEKVM
jgi:hypothetical protein